MTDPRFDDMEEKPLDPAAEALRRKMMRLMIISVGTLFIGVMAVLFAVVFKMNAGTASSSNVEATIDLPDGFNVNETTVDDGRIFLRGQKDGQSVILIFDLNDGSPSGRINLD